MRKPDESSQSVAKPKGNIKAKMFDFDDSGPISGKKVPAESTQTHSNRKSSLQKSYSMATGDSSLASSSSTRQDKSKKDSRKPPDDTQKPIDKPYFRWQPDSNLVNKPYYRWQPPFPK